MNMLKSLFIDKLILFTKASSSNGYAKVVVESLFERISKEHTANGDNMNKVVADSAEVCKTTTEKVDKLIADSTTFMENFQTIFNSNTTTENEDLKSLGSLFKIEKTKLQEICSGLKNVHEAFQTSISSQIVKLQQEHAKENDLKESLAIKTEEVKELSAKLNTSEKQIKALIRNKGKSLSGGSRKEEPKAPVKPVINQEPKGKEKLFSDEPIIDDDDKEEPDEEELKRRKGREANINEHQRIIHEAEEKERAEKEAQTILQSKKLLFLAWTMKRIQNDAVDLTSHYLLEPIVSFDFQNTQDSQLDIPITT
ncbi:unnamed protein product [Lactuca saligna]|uniref:Uncharacterized protein n=1 Tax=Lactuca saligna TaxID=75948 RepID=A0AA35YWY6_LACSI|nr:unnamed protein product [Lactuca saligna]